MKIFSPFYNCDWVIQQISLIERETWECLYKKIAVRNNVTLLRPSKSSISLVIWMKHRRNTIYKFFFLLFMIMLIFPLWKQCLIRALRKHGLPNVFSSFQNCYWVITNLSHRKINIWIFNEEITIWNSWAAHYYTGFTQTVFFIHGMLSSQNTLQFSYSNVESNYIFEYLKNIWKRTMNVWKYWYVKISSHRKRNIWIIQKGKYG